mmetsp:Transcript_19642/g.27624  ORF Transcript_19642/g.27624 Transcript_19642/m.27624 type:complete len:526 (+) Transcript_19642:252-1829(+)
MIWTTISFRKQLYLQLVLTTILVITRPNFVHAKKKSGKVLLTGTNSEGLLVKYAVPGHHDGRLEVNLRIPVSKGMYEDERYLRLHVFDETKWHIAKKKATCHDKVKNASGERPVRFEYKKDYQNGNKKEPFWVSNITLHRLPATSSARDAPQFWYFTLTDCSLETSLHTLETAPEMSYDLDIVHYDPKYRRVHIHASAQMDGMITLRFLDITITLLLGATLIFKLYKRATKSSHSKNIHNHSSHTVHLAPLFVLAACASNISSSFLELMHIFSYSRNGIGFYTADALAAHCEAISDAILAIILLSIGNGWTLPGHISSSHSNTTIKGNTFSRAQQIMFAIVLLAHTLLAQWGRTFDDDFDTYHSLEHPPGRALMILRASLCIPFLLGTASVKKSGRFPDSLQSFWKAFIIVGLAWFLSLPFIMKCVNTLSPLLIPRVKKHLCLNVGSAMVQICSLISLTWMFGGEEGCSAYHRLSRVNDLSGQNDLGSLSGGSDGASGGGGGRRSSAQSFNKSFFQFGNTKIRID